MPDSTTSGSSTPELLPSEQPTRPNANPDSLPPGALRDGPEEYVFPEIAGRVAVPIAEPATASVALSDESAAEAQSAKTPVREVDLSAFAEAPSIGLTAELSTVPLVPQPSGLGITDMSPTLTPETEAAAPDQEDDDLARAATGVQAALEPNQGAEDSKPTRQPSSRRTRLAFAAGGALMALAIGTAGFMATNHPTAPNLGTRHSPRRAPATRPAELPRAPTIIVHEAVPTGPEITPQADDWQFSEKNRLKLLKDQVGSWLSDKRFDGLNCREIIQRGGIPSLSVTVTTGEIRKICNDLHASARHAESVLRRR